MQRYFRLTGRAGRRDMWVTYLLASVIAMLVYGAVLAITGLAAWLLPPSGAAGFYVVTGAFVVMWLVFCAVVGATMVRRLHDLDRTGWWLAVYAACGLSIPLGAWVGAPAPFRYGLIGATLAMGLSLAVGLFFLPGKPADNRFGPPPAPP